MDQFLSSRKNVEVLFAKQGQLANPFQRDLLEIIHSEGLPELSRYQRVAGQLSSQEDKLHVLALGLVPALYAQYRAALSLQGQEHVRRIIVVMFESFARIHEGRMRLLTEVGTANLLAMFDDEDSSVRRELCKLFNTLVAFPDVHREMHLDREVMQKLVQVFVEDFEQVARLIIPAIATLSEYDQHMSQKTMTKLVALLKDSYNLDKIGSLEAISTRRAILTCFSNVLCDLKVKDLAISSDLVAAVEPLLSRISTSDCPTFGEIKDKPGSYPAAVAYFQSLEGSEERSLAAATLMAITVAERGKSAVIERQELVRALCGLVIAEDTPKELLRNCTEIIRNISENPLGLQHCGLLLLKNHVVLLDTLGPEATSRILGALLEAPVKHIQDSVLDALIVLARVPEGGDACFSIVEIVDRLVSISAARAAEYKQAHAHMKGLVEPLEDRAMHTLVKMCETNPHLRAEYDDYQRRHNRLKLQ